MLPGEIYYFTEAIAEERISARSSLTWRSNQNSWLLTADNRRWNYDGNDGVSTSGI